MQKEVIINAVGKLYQQRFCNIIYDNQNIIKIKSACPICVKREIQDIFGINNECQELIVDVKKVNDNFYSIGNLSNETVILKLKLPKNYKE